MVGRSTSVAAGGGQGAAAVIPGGHGGHKEPGTGESREKGK